VRHPALFLLDEPLSNLDARLRLGVRQYIRDVQRRLHVTTLYVTHDQAEAMTLGDRIVVMDQGCTQQVDTPLAVYERPANTFVAGFIGTPPMNLLPAQYADGAVHIADQRLPLRPAQCERLGRDACRLTVGMRPEAFAARTEATGFVARVDTASCEVLGSETLVRAAIGDHEVRVRLFGAPRDIPHQVVVPLDLLHIFAAHSGARIDL
jgi:ABC-type sugar transport system ATPase subunit